MYRQLSGRPAPPAESPQLLLPVVGWPLQQAPGLDTVDVASLRNVMPPSLSSSWVVTPIWAGPGMEGASGGRPQASRGVAVGSHISVRTDVGVLSGQQAGGYGIAGKGQPGDGLDRLSRRNRQIRSGVLRVDLVGSRQIWPAHVGGLVGPHGSGRTRGIDWMIKAHSTKHRMACRWPMVLCCGL